MLVKQQFGWPGLLVLAACAGGDATGAGYEVSRSMSGDTTIVRTSGPGTSAVSRQLVEVASVGYSAGEPGGSFGQITEVRTFPDGGALVFDRQPPELRHYDSTARFVRLFGRAGSGPGEYTAANGIVVRDDGSVTIWDAATAQIISFAPDGEFRTAWLVPTNGRFFTSNALFTDTSGAVLVRARIKNPPPAGSGARTSSSANTMGLLRYLANGTIADSLEPPVSPLEPALLVAESEGSIAIQGVPFAPSFQWTYSRMGYLVSGRTDQYTILLHRPAGGPIRIEKAAEPIRIAAAERENSIETMTGTMRSMIPDWKWNGPEVPLTKPFFRSIRVDDEGRIWVLLSTVAEEIPESELVEPGPMHIVDGRPPETKIPPLRWREPVVYDVFAPDGDFLGTVPLPPKTQFHAARGDHIWAVASDSLDVQRLARFRIVPGLNSAGR